LLDIDDISFDKKKNELSLISDLKLISDNVDLERVA
jgi:hypothetical protein